MGNGNFADPSGRQGKLQWLNLANGETQLDGFIPLRRGGILADEIGPFLNSPSRVQC